MLFCRNYSEVCFSTSSLYALISPLALLSAYKHVTPAIALHVHVRVVSILIIERIQSCILSTMPIIMYMYIHARSNTISFLAL